MPPRNDDSIRTQRALETKRSARGSPAGLQRDDVRVVERRQALEHDRAHTILQMEDFTGVAELRADPLAPQHLARRHNDRLLMVGIEVSLDRIADDDDGAILEIR